VTAVVGDSIRSKISKPKEKENAGQATGEKKTHRVAEIGRRTSCTDPGGDHGD
jgi:hypothetical protein